MRLTVRVLPTAIALLLTLSLWGSVGHAEDCELAVDMMESNDAVNRMGDCDYSEEGLNGWLTGRGADDDKPAPALQGVTSSSASSQTVLAGEFTLTQAGLKTALDLLQARFDLVTHATERCPGEAVLSEESYMSQSQGNTGLNMKFYCR